MNRRNFLGVLACLPGLGWLKAEAQRPLRRLDWATGKWEVCRMQELMPGDRFMFEDELRMYVADKPPVKFSNGLWSICATTTGGVETR